MINPNGCSLNTWANSLFVDFPFDCIPILTSDSEWKNWASSLVNCDSFKNANVRAPRAGDVTWKQWASDLYQAMELGKQRASATAVKKRAGHHGVSLSFHGVSLELEAD